MLKGLLAVAVEDDGGVEGREGPPSAAEQGRGEPREAQEQRGGSAAGEERAEGASRRGVVFGRGRRSGGGQVFVEEAPRRRKSETCDGAEDADVPERSGELVVVLAAAPPSCLPQEEPRLGLRGPADDDARVWSDGASAAKSAVLLLLKCRFSSDNNDKEPPRGAEELQQRR